jgi:outer membrane immunogenic protein
MARTSLVAAVLVTLAGTPIFAADLPVKARPIPPPVAAFSWTGCYVGANAGWIGGRTSYNTAPSGAYLNPAGVQAPPNAAGTGLLAGDFNSAVHRYRSDNSGGEVGGQIGCNWQTGVFVAGGEADFNWTGVRNSVTTSFGAFPSANPAFTVSPETESLTTRLNWLSTVRARGGFAWNQWLLYATGGLAIGQFDSRTSIVYGTSGTSPVFGGASHFGSNSTTRLGWTVGGGAEYAIDSHWSLKAEYLFVDFGKWSYASPLVTPAAAIPAGYSWSTSVSAREHLARIGFNYRFSDWFAR